MTDALRRFVLIAGVLAVIVGLGIADAGGHGGGIAGIASQAGASSAAEGFTVAPAEAESSAWFCVGGTGPDGAALATVILTNSTARTVTGTLTAVPAGGAAHSTSVVVAAHSQIGVVPTQVATGDSVAATVVLNGGGVGVSQVVSGPLGFSVAPCASTTSDQWYFADATTASGATLALSLFNPTRTTAVVDVSFVSPTGGVLEPPAYQGIDVPGDSLVTENVGDHVRNNPDVATEVSSLSGDVVAAQLESFGAAGSEGPSVVLGTVTPSPTWSFAQNTDVTGGATVFHIFNPSTRLVRVRVRFALVQGAAEPLVLRVPAQSIASLDTHQVTRIPSDTAFAVTFEAERGAGVIVDRHVASPAGSPPPQLGVISGVPGGDDHWLLPAATTPVTEVSLAVVGLNDAPVTISLSMFLKGRMVSVPGFAHRRLPAGTPLIMSPGPSSPVGTVPLVLATSAPVAVEVDALPVGTPGVVVIPTLPLA